MLQKNKSKVKIAVFVGVAILLTCCAGTQFTAPVSANSEPIRRSAPPAPAPLEGISVPGNNLTEKFAWLERSADSHNVYILEVNADQNIAPQTLQYSGAINITVVLRGDSQNRTVRLASNGTMFTVNPNVTLILDNNITLHGHSQNTHSLVAVNGGTFIMNDGATITGNNNTGRDSNGGGVFVAFGTFEMRGGIISHNVASSGGGVSTGGGGFGGGHRNFTMSGGSITENRANDGGGVFGCFTMTDGAIYGNTANDGGGVFASHNFTLRGGVISDNTAMNNGGGVFVQLRFQRVFQMFGGTITANTAHNSGGGVFVKSDYNAPSRINTHNFEKAGGIITGYNSDPTNGNVVKDQEGNILARRGHAVFVQTPTRGNPLIRRKETTSGQRNNLTSAGGGSWCQ